MVKLVLCFENVGEFIVNLRSRDTMNCVNNSATPFEVQVFGHMRVDQIFSMSYSEVYSINKGSVDSTWKICHEEA